MRIQCPLCGKHVLGTSGVADPFLCEFLRLLMEAIKKKETVH